MMFKECEKIHPFMLEPHPLYIVFWEKVLKNPSRSLELNIEENCQ